MLKRNPNSRFYAKPYIPYYVATPNSLILPRGTLTRLLSYFRRNALEHVISDSRIEVSADLKSTISLRPYQEGVPELIASHNQGYARLDTGFGKTIMALKVIELIQQRTLIIVPNINLLNQFVYEINKNFNTTAGVIRGKHMDIQDITVATVQTLLRRLSDSRGLAREFGCVITDECHKFPSPRSRQVVESFHSMFRYGFTATDIRSDQQGPAIAFIFGEKIINRIVPRAKPRVEVRHCTVPIAYGEYYEIIDSQTNNEERNTFIKNIIKEKIKEGRKVLVLTKRIKHYQDLERGIKAKTFSFNSKEDNKETLEKLRQNKLDYDCLFGTTSLLATGTDIPSLDCLIIACDLKSEALSIQAIGRIQRLLEGKPDPLVIDIADEGNKILHRQAKAREKIYKQNDWEICGIK